MHVPNYMHDPGMIHPGKHLCMHLYMHDFSTSLIACKWTKFSHRTDSRLPVDSNKKDGNMGDSTCAGCTAVPDDWRQLELQSHGSWQCCTVCLHCTSHSAPVSRWETAASKLDSKHGHNMVFEQMRSVDWLRTATVYATSEMFGLLKQPWLIQPGPVETLVDSTIN